MAHPQRCRPFHSRVPISYSPFLAEATRLSHVVADGSAPWFCGDNQADNPSSSIEASRRVVAATMFDHSACV